MRFTTKMSMFDDHILFFTFLNYTVSEFPSSKKNVHCEFDTVIGVQS